MAVILSSPAALGRCRPYRPTEGSEALHWDSCPLRRRETPIPPLALQGEEETFSPCRQSFQCLPRKFQARGQRILAPLAVERAEGVHHVGLQAGAHIGVEAVLA